MKTFKKALSVMLCLCMIMSAMAVGLNVFAQEKSEAVARFEADAKAFTGDVTKADPSAEDLEAYEKLVAEYKALSNSDKESIDVMVFDVFYHNVVMRERQISIKNHPEIASSRKDHYVNAAAQAVTTLGYVPAYIDNAVKLAQTIADRKVSVDDKKAAWEAADYNTRVMAGGYGSTHGIISGSVKGDAFKGFKLMGDVIYNDLLKANPAPTKPKSPGLAPKPGSYAEGENDPQYIADFAAWLEKAEAYNKAYAAEYTYKGNLYIEALEWLASVEPSLKAPLETIKAVREGKSAYDSGAGTSKASAAVKKYDAMSDAEKTLFGKISYAFYGVAVDNITSWSYKSFNATALYNACIDIGNARYVDYFVVVIENIEEPYDRADIEAAKAAYAKVPATLQSQIPTDTLAKYKDILASIAPDEPTGERPNVEIMKSTAVKYPFGASKKSVNKSLNRVEDILFTALSVPENGLSQMLKEGVYTNYTVALIAKKLFPIVGGLTSLVAKGPKDLASKLDKDTCAGAIAALNAAAETVDAEGNTVGKLDAWQYLTVVDGDFGFMDGDREGFLDAVASLFRPLSLITMVITLENTCNTTSGNYIYGGYEELVPILEVLGADGIMSSVEYTEYVNAGANSDEKMDRRIRGILVPVFNLVDAIASAESPLTEVVKLLPKVAYAVDSGLLNTQIQKLIGKLGMGLGNSINVDLTTEGLYEMLAPKLKDIELQAAKVDENGEETAPAVTLSINLDKDKFVSAIKDLSGCGVYTANESIARGKNWFVSIDGDAADVFVVLFRYLHSELTSESNAAAIKTAVKALDMNFAQRIAVNLLVSIVLSSSADGALRTLVFMIPIVKVGVKVASWFGAFKK